MGASSTGIPAIEVVDGFVWVAVVLGDIIVEVGVYFSKFGGWGVGVGELPEKGDGGA